MHKQLQKALSMVPGLAAAVLVVSPSHATSPSDAPLYGQVLAGGTLQTGQTGIQSITHTATGHYCILPSSTSLQTEVAAGTVGVQLTASTANWPFKPQIVAQVFGTHVTNSCPSNKYIGVTIEQYTGAAAPTATSGSGPLPTGYVFVDADFTILFD
jgi:hypothetical protein